MGNQTLDNVIYDYSMFKKERESKQEENGQQIDRKIFQGILHNRAQGNIKM